MRQRARRIGDRCLNSSWVAGNGLRVALPIRLRIAHTNDRPQLATPNRSVAAATVALWIRFARGTMFAVDAEGWNGECRVSEANELQTCGMFAVGTIYGWHRSIGNANGQCLRAYSANRNFVHLEWFRIRDDFTGDLLVWFVRRDDFSPSNSQRWNGIGPWSWPVVQSIDSFRYPCRQDVIAFRQFFVHVPMHWFYVRRRPPAAPLVRLFVLWLRLTVGLFFRHFSKCVSHGKWLRRVRSVRRTDEWLEFGVR